MKSIVCILMYFLIGLISCSNAQHTANQQFITRLPEDTLHWTPQTLAAAIAATDSVEVFQVDGWKRDTSAQGLQRFKVLQRGNALYAPQKTELVHIILNPAMYRQDSLVKHCQFAPNYGFRWRTGGQTQVLLVALDCDVWQWHHGAVPPIILEADHGRGIMRSFAEKCFAKSSRHALHPTPSILKFQDKKLKKSNH